MGVFCFMFEKIKKFFKDGFFVPIHPKSDKGKKEPVTSCAIEKLMGDCADVIQRKIRPEGCPELSLWFVDGLVNGEQLSLDVVRPLLVNLEPFDEKDKDALKRIMISIVNNIEAKELNDMNEAAEALLNGSCVLVFENTGCALGFEAKGGDKRAVTEPAIENVVKGSKDAFVETLRVNTALLRRKIKTPHLKIAETVVGRQSRTRVDVVYIDGLTSQELVRKVQERLEQIDVDGMLMAAQLEEGLCGSVTTFPLLLFTDLTDRFARHIMEGRVGLLIDGFPIGYLMPATFTQFMRAPEDEGNNYIVASSIRFLRYIALIITLLLPGFYVAIASFHQEMIPYSLARAIVTSKQGVPFTTTAEVIGMLIAFEILQEAGLRLPKTLGQTVSIVGALIVGQSAVEARIFSPVVVIVVAVAGVAGYTIPNQDFAASLRIWRFIIVIAASFLGLNGMAAAIVILVYHLSTLETFDVPYLSPMTGKKVSHSFLRSVFRPPYDNVPYRDESLNPENRRSRK